jgi:hypothetical protein
MNAGSHVLRQLVRPVANRGPPSNPIETGCLVSAL